MKRIKSEWVVAGMLLLTMGLSKSLLADVKEEAQLRNAQSEIDQRATVWSNDDHVKTLAAYYKVPGSVVQDLSNNHQGWGAANIELAMAWQLNTMHSMNFPFMTASLNRVEELRAEGKGWGDIAKTLDIGLGPVVQDAQNTAKELREDDLASTQKDQESAKVNESRRIIREEHEIAIADRANNR